MQRATGAWAAAQASQQFFVGEERAVLDRRVDAGQILIDDAPCADIHMPNFGVAHLPVRQADVAAFGMHQRVRAVGEQAATIWRSFACAIALSD